MQHGRARSARLVVAALLAAVAIAATTSVGASAQTPAPASRASTRPVLPEPAAFFGFRPGADRRLESWEAITGYFRAVAAASDRVRLVTVGASTAGRPFIVAYISSPENLARLDAITAWNAGVAHGVVDPSADRSMPATVMITAGIHATEFTGTQAAPELLWLLASGMAPGAERLLHDCVLALVPSFNPDGLEIVRAWYERTLDTPWEGTWPPTLYHPYVGHDNNRDAYMLTQVESQHVNKLLYETVNPQLYVDQHHMGNSDARMFIGEMFAPLNPSIDPQTVMNVQLVGSFMRSTMTAEGRRGLLHRANWNGFWQGGFFTNAWWHHIPAILTETATMRLATPIFQKPSDLDGSYFRGVGKNGNAKDWNHPWPWAGGWWRPRDGVEYDLSASLAALNAASLLRNKLAADRWQAARRSIDEGAQAPVAWVLPAAQHDASAVDRFLDKLLAGGAVALRAKAAFDVHGHHHAAGTVYLPAAQAYRAFVRDAVEPQQYPERRTGDHVETPFDWTGWTLAMQMGVRVERVVAWPGAQAPAASVITAASSRPAAASRPVDDPAGLAFWSGPARPSRRVGVYQSWTAEMDEGWNRWILDRFKLPYTTLHDADVRAGDLRARFDTILLSSMNARTIRLGHAADAMPPEFCGGLGAEGGSALTAFVKAGGRLVCLNEACDYALELFGADTLGVDSITARLDGQKFSCPGSLLAVEPAVDAPGTFVLGLPTELVVPFANSRAFAWRADGAGASAPQATTSAPAESRPARGRHHVIARYALHDLCRSGWILGPEHIAGSMMACAVQMGEGSVVLLGAPVQFRAQSEAAFPFLLNALFRP